ncbi:MAG: DUF4833 domain-containing protein [Pseudomonadota bacterium]
MNLQTDARFRPARVAAIIAAMGGLREGIFGVLALAAALAAWGGEPADAAAFPIFHVTKSDSRNEVHYATVLGADCRFAADAVRVTWFRPGEAPRPLTWIEELLVYGVRLTEAGANRIMFTLAADDTRPVVAEALNAGGGCRVRARVRINGQWAEPAYAHVRVSGGGALFPDIAHVDLHARTEGGSPVCERLRALRTPGVPCPAAR